MAFCPWCIFEGLEGRKTRDKCCNYIIIFKTKIKKGNTGRVFYSEMLLMAP